ncbi:unnamed protein product [Agarophyton chilense]|eukprot:gb/GEZJ01002203.1/.p1 GENE.gb/GEZJ01002203.1/~~gb/GEZJ01002203.1/.p1  ORF type:complete len:301 (-),score=38.78 gb/GEZJ01002203.1/:756-1658(-)
MNPKQSKSSSRRIASVVFVVPLIFLAFFLGRELHYYRPLSDDQKQSYCKEHLAGNRFHPITRILQKFKKPVTVLDVGAHIGFVTLPALYCLPVQHSTLTIEPVPVNANELMRGVRRMGNAIAEKRISFRQVAFSNVSDSLKIYVPNARSDNAALSKKASVANIGNLPLSEVNVKLRKGDDLINDMVKELGDKRLPQIVKIDTQGQEPRVLEGMKTFLTEHRDDGLLVLAEHDKGLLKTSGFDAYPVYDFMEGLGYRVYCMPQITVTNDGQGDIQVTGTQWTRDQMNSKRCEDLVYWAGKK